MTRRRSRSMSTGQTLGAGLAVALCALAVGALVPRHLGRRDPGGRNDLHLVPMNAFHVDIALPATPEVRRRLAFLRAVGIPVDHPRMSHILVGWGGRDFYPNTHQPWRVSPRGWLESIFADESALRFDPVADIGGSWGGRRPITVSDEGLSALLDFVLDTLERNADGTFRPIDHYGLNETDHFFKARPTFTAFAGCNVWASRALAAAGIASGRWTPLPQPLFASIWWHRRGRAGGPGRPTPIPGP